MLCSPALCVVSKVFLSSYFLLSLHPLKVPWTLPALLSRLVSGLPPSSLSRPKISAPCKTSIRLPSRRTWTMASPTGCAEPTPMSRKLSPPLPPRPRPPAMEDQRHPVATRYLFIIYPRLEWKGIRTLISNRFYTHLKLEIDQNALKPFCRLPLNLVESWAMGQGTSEVVFGCRV